MHTPSTFDDARAALAMRQREVVADLLAGRVPDGFDPIGATLTTDILVGKRIGAVFAAGPQLAELPQWRAWFRRYACQVPVRGCAHDDLDGFLRWLENRTDLDTGARGWVAVEQVYAGTRRAVWVRYRGRRELVVGFGSRTWHLAVSKPHGCGSSG